MANKTLVEYALSGTQFRIPFEYLSRQYVVVTLIKPDSPSDNKVLKMGDDYIFINSVTIELTTTATQGYTVLRIHRYTGSDVLVSFRDGSVLTANDLTVSELQAIHIAEEGRDYTLQITEETLQAVQQAGEEVKETIKSISNVSAYGYEPLWGKTFKSGAELGDWTKVLLWAKAEGGDDNYYKWTGDFPKVVSPESSPVVDSKWVQITDRTMWDAIRRATATDVVMSFGATADYTGEPQYDGLDATRITATDNTPMFLNAIKLGQRFNDTLVINVPAGHYGFKTRFPLLKGSELGVKHLVFVGAGMDATILDYVAEDPDNVGSNETSGAKELFPLDDFETVTFESMTCKATTKLGITNNTSAGEGIHPLYNGTIWFAHITKTKVVTCRNVRVSHCHYRGISVNGGDLPVGQRTIFNVFNCEGYRNVGSGFWARSSNEFNVFGDSGRYHRNGVRGQTATGYGVTASQYVDKFTVVGGSFYENYRKGVDKHGGLGSVVLSNVYFADNVLWDFSSDHQYIGLYPEDTMDSILMSNCHSYINKNREFFEDAVGQLPVGFTKTGYMLSGRKIDNTPSGRMRTMQMDNCSLTIVNPISLTGFQGVVGRGPELRLNNFKMDIRGLGIGTTNAPSVYNNAVIAMSDDHSVLVMDKCNIITGNGAVSGADAVKNNSLLIQIPATGKLIMDNSMIDMTNYVFTAMTGAGKALPWTGKRKINSTTFKVRDVCLDSWGTRYGIGNELLSSGFFFGVGDIMESIGSNNLLGLGDADSTIPLNNGFRRPVEWFVLPCKPSSVGMSWKIKTLNLYGNMQFTATGRAAYSLPVAKNTYNAYWDGSQNTHRVAEVVGTAFTVSPTLTEEFITYSGNSTNFKLKVITASMVGAAPYANSWFDCTLSTLETALPVLYTVTRGS